MAKLNKQKQNTWLTSKHINILISDTLYSLVISISYKYVANTFLDTFASDVLASASASWLQY